MLTVFSSNDVSEIAFAQSLLLSAGITPYLSDVYTANIDANIGIIPQRVMVAESDASRALRVLKDNELVHG